MTLTVLRPAALVATAFMASILALFLEWRGRLVRRIVAGDGHPPAADSGAANAEHSAA